MNRVVCLSSSVVPKPNKIDAISADSRQKVGQTVLASQQPAVIGAGDDKGTDERDPETGSQYGGPDNFVLALFSTSSLAVMRHSLAPSIYRDRGREFGYEVHRQ
jgi:hypothetical protein